MCKACREGFVEQETLPPCKACEYGQPEVVEENEPVLWFIHAIGGMIGNGWGGINAEGVKLGMDLLNVPQECRATLIRKVTIYMSASASASKSKE
jgi:hypothetical protein